MIAPQELFYTKDATELLAYLRAEMSRRGDFEPVAGRYPGDESEVASVLEALLVEDEVLA